MRQFQSCQEDFTGSTDDMIANNASHYSDCAQTAAECVASIGCGQVDFVMENVLLTMNSVLSADTGSGFQVALEAGSMAPD